MRIHRVFFFIFISFFSFSWCLEINDHVQTAYCLIHQQSLLLHLKNSLLFDDAKSTKLSQWNQTSDCCQWDGVTCDAGLVVALDLGEESIYGGIDESNSLFSLQDLQSLNLSYNNLNTTIPSAFHMLAGLRNLYLRSAGFVGQIPIEISQLTSLVTLDISTDNVGVLKLKNPNLQTLIQNLSDIKNLYLDGVTISANGNEWCNALSSLLPKLQVLSLESCNLSGPLDPSLARLKSLGIINLSLNNLSSPIPAFFADFKNLTALCLRICGLHGNFPDGILQITSLKHLDVGMNDLQGKLPNSLSTPIKLVYVYLGHNLFSGPIPSFNTFKNLRELFLHGNNFSGRIPCSLFILPSLEIINLSDNQVEGRLDHCINISSSLREVILLGNHLEGPIPTSIFMLPSIESIDLRDNQFKGRLDIIINISSSLQKVTFSNNGLEGTIPSSLFMHPSLTFIALDGNRFDRLEASTNMSSCLRYLDLSNNSLEGTIPSSLFMLPSMVVIFLSHNQFKGQLDNFENVSSSLVYLEMSNNHLEGPIPSSIWNLPSLDTIKLDHNQFVGQLEAFINASSRLELLDLSNNNLYGVIPQDMGNYLPRLFFLSLSSNKFKGSVPKSLCNLIALDVLDLSKNFFTGRIPECLIAMAKTLEVLYLSRNKLSGGIVTLPDSCNLHILHLSDNLLGGMLPKYLATCTNLQVLDMGNNRFNDNFPCWLNNLPALQVLVLRSNQLHGSISCARTNASFSNLHILDLASNNLSGSVPPEMFKSMKEMMLEVNDKNHRHFRDWVSGNYYTVNVIFKGLDMELIKTVSVLFTSIDLSYNKFEGPIPEEIGQLKGLHMLNLSHNNFSNHIPSSLGNLKNLESLDLSHNSLSGEIPTQLASMDFLEVLNLSFNHLAGTIPTGTQLQTFPSTSFVGNEQLCGPPLTQNCSKVGAMQVNSYSGAKSSIDWNLISVELGFTFGIGVVFLSLLFWKPWRLWYWEHAENLLYYIFPQLDFVYEIRGGRRYRTLRWRGYWVGKGCRVNNIRKELHNLV